MSDEGWGLRVLRFAGSLGIVAAITAVFFRLVRVNSTTVALTLLMGVLAIATKWGLAEAVTASIAAMLCFNFFFLPPTGTFTVEDPQNWVALGAFLLTAVVASQLSASARKRATEAIQRQAEMERLYTLSRAMMLADAGHDVARQVAQWIAQTFDVRGVVIYDRRTEKFSRAGAVDIEVADEKVRAVAMEGALVLDSATAVFMLPIRLGGEPIGSIALSGIAVSDTALVSVANLVAIALERARSLEAASRAEAARQSEELKSMLLDAVAHEFKTPLTSIKAGATALLSDSVLNPSQRELLSVIDEETDRLIAMISEAIQVARVEAGSVQLNRASNKVSWLVAQAAGRLRPALEERPLEMQIPADLPAVVADPDLVPIAIAHLLDNAIKYSQAGTLITISARTDGDAVIISVSDRGPGITPEDRSRVFERFYRGVAGGHVPGTGMGLSIASEIVKGHGGRIWVENAREGGACFSFSLPLAEPADKK